HALRTTIKCFRAIKGEVPAQAGLSKQHFQILTMSTYIDQFWNELTHKKSSINHEEWFTSLANILMNHLHLVVGNNTYRITECEFYYMDYDHQDGFVHCGDEQMTAGKLYLNKVGG